MSRIRSFTKSEIMDAARAAAETGLCATLRPSGEITFTHEPRNDNVWTIETPEGALENWLNGNKTRRSTHR